MPSRASLRCHVPVPASEETVGKSLRDVQRRLLRGARPAAAHPHALAPWSALAGSLGSPSPLVTLTGRETEPTGGLLCTSRVGGPTGHSEHKVRTANCSRGRGGPPRGGNS